MPTFFFSFLLLSWISQFESQAQGSFETDRLAPFPLSPAPDSGETDHQTSFPPESAPIFNGEKGNGKSTPAPAPDQTANRSEIPTTPPFENLAPPPESQIPAPGKTNSKTVKWCAVRDEFVDCQYYLSLLRQTDDYTWKCVRRETIEECLKGIKNEEADLINLEPGLAYIAFMNYSMKAILNEVYCDHARSFDSVAVVKRKACERNGEPLGLNRYRGAKSCHGGYGTAAGWNYAVNRIRKTGAFSKEKDDRDIVTAFFGAACAPSELEGKGECGGCGSSDGNGNGTCLDNGLYSGDGGAFRCLVEEVGDIAFVRADTPVLYSLEGRNNQSWSTKSVREFMYLCPQGGCREINGYPGSCKFGTVPANTIMTHNSISKEKKLVIMYTLLNATWIDALYTGKNGAGHLLSPSTQGLAEVKQLTRSYLGTSASISQTIQDLNLNKVQNRNGTIAIFSSKAPVSKPRVQYSWIVAILLFLL